MRNVVKGLEETLKREREIREEQEGEVQRLRKLLMDKEK